MYGLIPYGGLKPVRWLSPDIDRIWESFFGEVIPVEGGEEGFVPSVDLKEGPEEYELVAEVPGLKPEEIHVELKGDVLILSGEKKEEREEVKGEYRLVERRCGSFHRSFRLPEPIEREKLSAVHKDGVLRVHLPKSHGGGSVKVEVKGS
ncbi:MAG: Hsp20/alpha crystallin family protein [Pseudomonadota bacterium]